VIVIIVIKVKRDEREIISFQDRFMPKNALRRNPVPGSRIFSNISNKTYL
jgi:hypothetical protein